MSKQQTGGIEGQTSAKLLLITTIIIVVAMLAWRLGTKQLNGMLIDLELSRPDPLRYATLKSALTEKLPTEVPALRDVAISLDYEHFTTLSPETLNPEKVDFLILSPQATPWHLYSRNKPAEFENAKKLLLSSILDTGIPVLGICGGHQMLALAFGGSVGFIDKNLDLQHPDTYPKEGTAERGTVVVDTLHSDPIFSGIVDHPGRFLVSQSHFEEVKSVPTPLVNLARTSLSEIQILRLPGRPVYGVAFHPERGWESSPNPSGIPTGGKQILVNFVAMVLKEKNQKHN